MKYYFCFILGIKEFQTYKEAFTEVAQFVIEKRREYEYNVQDSEMLDQLEEQISNEIDEEMFDDIAPVTQHAELADRQKKKNKKKKKKKKKKKQILNDIATDLGMSAGSDIQQEIIFNRMQDDEIETKKKSSTMCSTKLKQQMINSSYFKWWCRSW